MVLFHNQKIDESKVLILQSTITKLLLLEELLHKFKAHLFCVHLVNLRKLFLHFLRKQLVRGVAFLDVFVLSIFLQDVLQQIQLGLVLVVFLHSFEVGPNDLLDEN